MSNKKTAFLVQAVIIAALYTAVTVAVAPISYGQIQFRVSECLCILPIFAPAAIPGLFIGCMFSNAIGLLLGQPILPIDIILGSAATLIAAFLTYKTRKISTFRLPLISMFFPVLANAVIIGAELVYLLKTPFIINALWVGFGELVVCYGLGIPLYLCIKKIGENKIFKT